jgi:hypothetical protein
MRPELVGKHPRLYFSREELPELRRRSLGPNRWFLDQARSNFVPRLVGRPVKGNMPAWEQYLYGLWGLSTIDMRYAIQGGDRYVETAKTIVRWLLQQKDLGEIVATGASVAEGGAEGGTEGGAEGAEESAKPVEGGEPPMGEMYTMPKPSQAEETPPVDQATSQLYRDAETAFIDGDVDNAKALFEKIVEQHPGSTFAPKAKEYLQILE